jgi:hypothetical protein
LRNTEADASQRSTGFGAPEHLLGQQWSIALYFHVDVVLNR